MFVTLPRAKKNLVDQANEIERESLPHERITELTKISKFISYHKLN